MILTDWSQLVIAGSFAFSSDFKKGQDTSKMIDILRHCTLTTILSYKRNYGAEYGDLIFAVDGRNYWRKEIFEPYKGHRKKSREESDIDWKSIFAIGSQLRDEFIEVLPYKFVRYDRAEADDIVAVLTKYWQTNELVQVGFEEEPAKVLIISNDGDFGQLHKYRNVRQWNPILKKYVERPAKHFLLEKVIQGDSGDGIPSIRSYDTQLMEGVRQKPITAQIKAAAVAQRENGEPILFPTEEMNRNYQRNQRLIDFDFIPADVEAAIIEDYLKPKTDNRKNDIFNYLIKHRCRNLMDSIQEF